MIGKQNFAFLFMRKKNLDCGRFTKKILRGNENPSPPPDKKMVLPNQNLYIEEQTTQWPKEKAQKDKQRSTKHTHKTKDRVTRTPLKLKIE